MEQTPLRQPIEDSSVLLNDKAHKEYIATYQQMKQRANQKDLSADLGRVGKPKGCHAEVLAIALIRNSRGVPTFLKICGFGRLYIALLESEQMRMRGLISSKTEFSIQYSEYSRLPEWRGQDRAPP